MRSGRTTYSISSGQDERADLSKGVGVTNVILQQLASKSSLVTTHPLRTVATGALLGLLLGLILAYLLEHIDDTIKGSDDIEKRMGVSLLGTVPMIAEEAEGDNTVSGGRRTVCARLSARWRRPSARCAQRVFQPVARRPEVHPGHIGRARRRARAWSWPIWRLHRAGRQTRLGRGRRPAPPDVAHRLQSQRQAGPDRSPRAETSARSTGSVPVGETRRHARQAARPHRGTHCPNPAELLERKA